MKITDYIRDENGDILLDDDGNKLEFQYESSNINYEILPHLIINENDEHEYENPKNHNMKNMKILNHHPAENDNDLILKGQVTDTIRESFLDLWISEYMRLYASCIYSIERIQYDCGFIDNTNYISTLYDKSFSESDATQNNNTKRPQVCTKQEKVNGRYYLKFNGTHSMISQANLNSDGVNIFCVFKLNQLTNGWSGSLFGHDNGGYDKYVSYYNKNFVISGCNVDCVYIGDDQAVQHFTRLTDYEGNHLNDLNKWHCLSIHWDNISSDNTNKSSVYHNKNLLGNFTSNKNSSGSNTTVFAGLNPNNNIGNLNGCIAFFGVYLHYMLDEKTIEDHHTILMQRYGIV